MHSYSIILSWRHMTPLGSKLTTFTSLTQWGLLIDRLHALLLTCHTSLFVKQRHDSDEGFPQNLIIIPSSHMTLDTKFQLFSYCSFWDIEAFTPDKPTDHETIPTVLPKGTKKGAHAYVLGPKQGQRDGQNIQLSFPDSKKGRALNFVITGWLQFCRCTGRIQANRKV